MDIILLAILNLIFKGIESRDFHGLFMVLSYILDIRHFPPGPLHILFILFYVFVFKFYHLG
jgi:hypothetical protein